MNHIETTPIGNIAVETIRTPQPLRQLEKA
jgi:hypothetical protein